MGRFKNGYQEDMCLKEIGLLAQNLLTILDSIPKHKRGTSCGLLMAHFCWALIIQNKSILASILLGISGFSGTFVSHTNFKFCESE